MTNEQIQALKAAAEKCISMLVSVDSNMAYANFIAMVEPELFLSLLAEREADKALIAELQSFKTAYMEWHDKTEWVQTDKRFDVLVPWGKHRADVLKAYIEHLEARTLTVKLPDYSEFAIVHFTGCSDDYAKGWVDGKNTVGKAYATACAAAGIKLQIEE